MVLSLSEQFSVRIATPSDFSTRNNRKPSLPPLPNGRNFLLKHAVENSKIGLTTPYQSESESPKRLAQRLTGRPALALGGDYLMSCNYVNFKSGFEADLDTSFGIASWVL